MKVFYEEKTYESYFNNELDNISSIYFPPGQVLEGALGFDSVSFTKDKKLWKKLGYPFRFNPHFLGADVDSHKMIPLKSQAFLPDIGQNKTGRKGRPFRPVWL